MENFTDVVVSDTAVVPAKKAKKVDAELVIPDSSTTALETTVTGAAKTPSIEQLTLEINFYLGQMRQNALEVGKRLIQARKIFGKGGKWNAWLKNNFKLSPDTASNFIRIAEKFGTLSETFRTTGYSEQVKDLGYGQMVKLLALPDGEVENFIEQMNANGTPIADLSVRMLSAAVKEYNVQIGKVKTAAETEIQKAKDAAQSQINTAKEHAQTELDKAKSTAQEELQKVQKERNDAQKEVESLQAQLSAAQSDVSTANATIKTFRQQIQTANDENKRLQEQLQNPPARDYDEEMKAKDDDIETLKGQKHLLNQELTEAKDEITSLNADKNKAQSDLTAANEKIKDLEKQVTELKNKPPVEKIVEPDDYKKIKKRIADLQSDNAAFNENARELNSLRIIIDTCAELLELDEEQLQYLLLFYRDHYTSTAETDFKTLRDFTAKAKQLLEAAPTENAAPTE